MGENWNDPWGSPVTYDNRYAWWWVPRYQTGSLSWTVVNNLNDHVYAWKNILFSPQLYWSGLQPGDFYYMDLVAPYNSGGPTHARVWIGWSQVYDNYNQPTGEWNNVADQHTTARYHVRWDANWDPSTQAVWKIHVIG